MKFLAIEKEIEQINPEEEKQILKSEARRVWDFYIDGYIREIYFTPQHTAVLILECENEEEAKSILESLPLVQTRRISFDITELLPYNGFERLFQK